MNIRSLEHIADGEGGSNRLLAQMLPDHAGGGSASVLSNVNSLMQHLFSREV